LPGRIDIVALSYITHRTLSINTFSILWVPFMGEFIELSLEQVPDAVFAITHDDDWVSVLNEVELIVAMPIYWRSFGLTGHRRGSRG
jgi:hypothetical protein